MNKELDLIDDFLACPTSKAWLDVAITQLPILLIDHAHCEKKAAATALHLIQRYPEQPELLIAMSRLAREELRHFEQVLAILRQKGIPFQHLSAAPYAQQLLAKQRTSEPGRLQDRLIIGAFIEARSCERFHALLPYLPHSLAQFYQRLAQAESRHFLNYLQLAENLSNKQQFENRCDFFRQLESEIIQQKAMNFRFHSGIPLDKHSETISS